MLNLAMLFSKPKSAPPVSGNTHSIELNGTSQYLSIADADQTGLDITGDMTIECDIKLSELASVGGTSFVFASKYETDSQSFTVGIGGGDDKLLAYYNDTADGSGYSYFKGADAFVAGDTNIWVHVAMVFDVSTPTVIFYKEGVAMATTTVQASATSIFKSTADVRIGRDIGSYFKGKMDNIRMWNSARTSTQINDNKGVKMVGNEANLQACWEFDGSTFVDKTANNNNLTNYNSATFSSDTPY